MSIAYDVAVGLGYSGGAKKNYLVKCVAHDDGGKPGLSLRDGGKPGQLIAKCFAGCTWEAIKDELLKRGLITEETHLEVKYSVDGYDQRVGSFSGEFDQRGYRFKELYPRYDRETRSQIVGFKARYEPKDFKWFMKNKPGGFPNWLSQKPKKDSGIAPYYYPQVFEEKATRVLHWPEGEKDADTLRNAFGYASWCFGGATDPLSDWFLDELIGCKGVIVWADNDKTGLESGAKRCMMLHARNIPCKLAVSQKGKDVTNWKEQGGTKEDIDKYWKALALWLPPSEQMKAAVDAGVVPNMPYDVGTEAFAAEVYAHRNRDTVRFVPGRGQWMSYDRKGFWAADEEGKHRELAKGMCQSLRQMAGSWSLEQRPALEKLASKVQTDSGIRAVLSMARSVPSIVIKSADLDGPATTRLFNCADGVFDLRDGQLKNHAPDFLITRQSPIHINFNRQPEQFIAFMHGLFPEKRKVVDYLLFFLAYCMTGETYFQKFQVWTGESGAGKSQLQIIMRAVLGPYCGDLSADTLRETKQRSAGVDSDLAQMAGKLLIFASELSEKHKLDTDLIKALTGEDVVRVKMMHKDRFDLKANAKLIFTCNQNPPYPDDDAFGRRLMEIRYERVFVETAEMVRQIGEKIAREEGDQIAGLLLSRAAQVVHESSGILEEIPDEIKGWTNETREEANNVKTWHQERVQPWMTGFLLSSEAFEDYEKWCSRMRIPQDLSIKGFGRRLIKLGAKAAKNEQGRRGYKDLLLRS